MTPNTPSAQPAPAPESQVVLVTGAGGGIGSAVVGELLDRGDTVVAVDLDTSRLDDLEAPGLHRITADLCDQAEIERVVAEASALGPVTGAALCAGINELVALEDLDAETWQRVLTTNLTAPIQLTRALCLALKQAGLPGSMVLLGSGAADTGHVHHTHYAASKAGMVAAAKSLATELGPARIRVNVVAPGPTSTPMIDRLIDDGIRSHLAAATPLGRMGEPSDIAPTVAFLLSDKAAFVTGQTVHVNGGFHLH